MQSSRSSGPRPVTPRLLREWPLPQPQGAKRSRGQVVVVGGSSATPGAVMLAGLAALRAGAGTLHLAVAESTAPHVAVAVPESGVTAMPQSPAGSVLPEVPHRLERKLTRTDGLLVGPGLDDAQLAGRLLAELMPRVPAAAGVVLDAYALSALPEEPSLAEPLAGRLVLTPNAEEAALLAQVEPDDLGDIADAVPTLARRYGAVVTCHGIVAGPDGELFDIQGGHAGLGTSGSGDVLAGTIAGLLARGAEPAQAACWGTYLHASAGDRLAARVGRLGFLARELLPEIPLVLTELSA
jgi:ADP-dependent NAD(P)H-hydrate dehydratase